MDQTVPTNSATAQSSIPNIPEQTTATGSGKRKLIIPLILIVLAIVLVVGGYFLGTYMQSKKAPAASTTPETVVLPAGFIKAQGLIDAGGNMVGKSDIQIGYNGVLTAINPDKGWTIKKGNKTVTVKQEGKEQVKYLKVVEAGTPGQPISAGDLKVGDTIALITLVDTKTGLVTVTNIVVTPKPGTTTATPSASPPTQKL